jgi:hypothetical protein
MEQVQRLRFRKVWSRKARTVFWIVFGVFLVGFFTTAVWLGFLGSQVVALKQSVDEAQRALVKYDLGSAKIAFDDAAERAETVERTLSFAAPLSVFPWVGETYVAYLQTLHVAVEGFLVASQALSVASSVTDAIDRAETGTSFTFLEDPRPYSDFSSSERRAALNAFAQSATDLRSLRIALELAAQDVARIDADALRFPQIIAQVKDAQEKIPELVTALDILSPFASVAREFAGVDAEAQFLILYLNNAELRPGGGFIGAYSLMHISEGEITNFSTEDSYSADLLVAGNVAYHVEPPLPIKQYIGIPDWYFRDAAWSPSFLQTAFDARQLLRQELAFGGKPIPDASHVLGITPDFIEGVLRLVGPISANGKTYTADNVYEVLQYDVEQGFVQEGISYEDRKTALKVISETMVDRLLEMSPSSWMDFFALFQDELAQKHVMLASVDGETQVQLEDAGWAGTFTPSSVDDLLMLVDANMGALKTDPTVERTVDYALAPTSSGYQATVTVTYNHTGTVDYKTGQYRTYAQLFVPEGSTLVSTTGLTHEVIAADSLDMTSFATFLEVEPGDLATISFIYDLPETVTHAIERGVYTLGVFKQVGAGDNLLTLHLDFGTNLVAADPQEDSSDYGNSTFDYTTELATDQIFRVTL